MPGKKSSKSLSKRERNIRGIKEASIIMEHLDKIIESFKKQAFKYSRAKNLTSKKILANFINIIPAKSTDKVLDVACGPGLVTLAIAKKVNHVIGIDITLETIKVAKNRAEKLNIINTDFKLGNATKLTYDDNSFDGVITRLSFHHMPNPIDALNEMTRVVKPGGYIAISDIITGENYADGRWHNTLERLRDPSHWMTLSKNGFHQILKEAKLKIKKEYVKQVVFNFDEWFNISNENKDTKQIILDLLLKKKSGVYGFKPKFKRNKLQYIVVTNYQVLAKKYV